MCRFLHRQWGGTSGTFQVLRCSSRWGTDGTHHKVDPEGSLQITQMDYFHGGHKPHCLQSRDEKYPADKTDSCCAPHPHHAKERWKLCLGHPSSLVWWLYLVCILSCTLAQNPGDWSSVPDSFRVLEGTKAEFHWTHTIPGYVEITWYYRGPRSKPVLESIMFFSNNKITIPKVGDRHSRLGYNDSVNGSAIMTLDDIRPTDQGDYEAKVVDLKAFKPLGFHIQDVAHMEVVKESSVMLQITIDNTTYNWSLVNNATDLWLPLQAVPYPYKFRVFVKVDDQAPPPSIQMEVINKKGSFKEPECDDYSCLRHMDPWYATAGDRTAPRHASLRWSVDFPVQNLEQIQLQLNVTEAMEEKESSVATTPTTMVSTGTTLFSTSTMNWSTQKEQHLTTERTILTIAGVGQSRRDPCDLYRCCVSVAVIVVVVLLFVAAITVTLVHLSARYSPKVVNPPLHDVSEKRLDKYISKSSHGGGSASFIFTVDFKKHIFVSVDAEKTVCYVLAAITALLNTEGGTVAIQRLNKTASHPPQGATAEKCDKEEIRVWLRSFYTFSVTTKRVITEHIYRTCVTNSVISTELRFDIKKAPMPVTYKYNTYTRDVRGIQPIRDLETIRHLICKTSCNVSDGDIDTGNKERYIEVTQFDHFNEEFVSMANVSGGGYIKVPKHEPSGPTADEESRPSLHEESDGINLSELILNRVQRKPSKDEDWMFDVDHKSVIKIKECAGCAFVKCPDYFVLVDNKQSVEKLPFKDWHRIIICQ